MTTTEHEALTVLHPLEPLSREELRTATEMIRAADQVPAGVRFSAVALREPSKDQLARYAATGERPAREALAVLVDRSDGVLIEAIADLDSGSVSSVTRRPGEHPPILTEEILMLAEAVRGSPEWQEALRKRGVTDLGLVEIAPLGTGRFGEDFEEHRRVARAVSWLRRDPTDNPYARPIEGVVAFVDLNTLEVFRVDDHGVVPFPDVDGRYAAGAITPRSDLQPLEVIQPHGPSFTVEGHEIRWQRWRLRISLHPMEGLVLHTLGFEDGGRVRTVMHRASLSEMVVPYGDPHPAHSWKNYFDAGEYGLGKLTNSLALGCDCLGEIRYFDAHLVDDDGEPYTIRNAICLHEEDDGILWKHHDAVAGTAEVRRSRRLVISAIHTVGNYDYGFYWHLYQDGTIQLECKLTGIVATAAVRDGEHPRYGAMIAERLAATHHQHIFCFRLDLDVDGERNSVYEVDSVPVPMSAANPLGNAFEPRVTPISSESEGRRACDSGVSRHWKVTNPERLNGVGEPVAYKLVPGHGNATLLAGAGSSVARRAEFARHNLWVTRYEPDERHAAGTYPYQHLGGAGLPSYASADRPLENADAVLWYCVGMTHFVRPEDWPVMPVEHAGFHLKPHGFFDRNPALDVPAPHGRCHAPDAMSNGAGRQEEP